MEMLAQILATGVAAGLAVGGYAYAGMWPTSQIFGRTLVAPRRPDEFTLTYDDGPNDPWTERLLDLLERYNVHATFFVLGKYARQRPDLVRMLRAAGHEVGNHSMTHPMLIREPAARVRAEIEGCNKAIEDATGEKVRFFRPPHGSRRPYVLQVARELELTPVLWNAMAYDWKPDPVEKMEQNALREIHRNQLRGRGTNLCLHDGSQMAMGTDRSKSVEVTDRLLARFAGSNRFVPLAEWAKELTRPVNS